VMNPVPVPLQQPTGTNRRSRGLLAHLQASPLSWTSRRRSIASEKRCRALAILLCRMPIDWRETGGPEIDLGPLANHFLI
jgi:hypothetical protein